MREKRILKLLYKSFEVQLTPKEKRRLKEGLKRYKHLIKVKKEISSQRKVVSDVSSHSFNPDFTERVMHRLKGQIRISAAPETFYQTLKTLFWRAAVIGAVCLIALLLYNISVGQNLPSEETFYISDLTYEEISRIPLF